VGFALDPRLAADTHFVCSLPACDVLLMNEQRYPWVILVPRVQGATELHALAEDVRAQVLGEVMQASHVLADWPGVEKLNTGTLGNIVRQLHVHLIGRHTGDPAWPGPVWGHSPRLPYLNGDEHRLVNTLRENLAARPTR
jgi:diadenosine tetraphosphate (Ap4A) HIT family hydrolase